MLFEGDECSLLPKWLQVLIVMHLQEEPRQPLNAYAQQREDQIAENQARMAASGLGAACKALGEATQPAAKKGRKRRADQENVPKVL